MKNNSAKILAAFLLLTVFLTGQAIVIFHSHNQSAVYGAANSKKTTTDTKCQICDQSSHIQLFLQLPVSVNLVASNVFYHQDFVPACQSMRVLISGNRGPPVV